ncbi:serine/threonine-protein kinase [Tautonia sociabilis]|uniref:Protein kinase domain-containing protein n=1 Tax=Tautonia sociabilis TaxID=2080755 RepID=A0A432MJ13_9BACT|nr:serine/threonine-protein kinase [Tautonia sociabilis]RUL87289.1 hypothetical protein TsocGM_12985 [Tautonia sociabilis]
MTRDDTDLDPPSDANSRQRSDSTIPTAPIPDDTPPLDLDRLAVMLAAFESRTFSSNEAPERSSRPKGDSTEFLFELRECLRLALGSWPRPGDGPRRIGRFEVLEERGRGGFGIVYRAFDPVLRRFVALKVPRIEGLALPELRRRFLREARAAGALEHPNIVPVFEAGEDGPLCYLAAAFVDGPTLSSWLHTRISLVPPADAAALVAIMSDAVHHAHTRGVLHRDLKPSNVLLQGVAPGDDLRPARPVPRLTDFGLAKLLEDAGEESRSGVPMGSPSYMSPEQAAGRRREIGPLADVYGLGAIFYEILTGRPPLRGESPMETIALVLSEQPVPPRALRPGIPRELETICLTCLHKDPSRRYPSAEALAADLRRWLAGDPIQAQPIPIGERLGRWARRRPARVGVILLLGILGAISAGYLLARDSWLASHREELEAIASREREQRAEAERQAELAERRLDASRLKQADQALSLGEIERALDILDDLKPLPSGPDFTRGFLRSRAAAEMVPLRGHHRSVIQLAVAPGSGAIASVDLDERLLLHPAGNTAAPLTLTGVVEGATYPEFSPDSRFLAAFETDGSGDDHRLGLTVWDARSGRTIVQFRPEEAEGVPRWFGFPGDRLLAGSWVGEAGEATVLVWSLAAPASAPRSSPMATIRIPAGGQVACGGRWLAIASPGRLVLVDPRSGEVVRELPDAPAVPIGLALSPDGRSIAVCHEGGLFELRDSESGAVLGRTSIADPLSPPCFSPRGKWAGLIDRAGTVALLGRDGEGPHTFSAATDDTRKARMAFSPEEDRIALNVWSKAGDQEATTVRRIGDGEILATYLGRPQPLSSLAFAPDGRHVVLAGGPTLYCWRLDPPEDPPEPAGHLDEAWSAAFSPNGRYLATGSDDTDEPQTLKLWEVQTGRLVLGWKAHPATVSALAFRPDGGALASAGLEAREHLRLWEPETGTLIAELIGHTDRVRTVAFSPDGRLLASSGSDRTVRLWDGADGSPLDVLSGPTETVRQVAFSPDGRSLACCDNGGEVWMWDLATRVGRVVLSRSDTYTSLAFSPDGLLLAVADEGGSVTLLDGTTLTILSTLRVDDGRILSLAFSPDSRALAIAGESRAVRVWDPVACLEVLSLDELGSQVNDLAFSPDGRILVSCSHDGAVRFWRSPLVEAQDSLAGMRRPASQ